MSSVGIEMKEEMDLYTNEDWETEKWRNAVELYEQVCAAVWKVGKYVQSALSQVTVEL